MFRKLTRKEKILKAIRKYSLTTEQIAEKLPEWPSMVAFDVEELLADEKIEITAKFNGKPCYSVK